MVSLPRSSVGHVVNAFAFKYMYQCAKYYDTTSTYFCFSFFLYLRLHAINHRRRRTIPTHRRQPFLFLIAHHLLHLTPSPCATITLEARKHLQKPTNHPTLFPPPPQCRETPRASCPPKSWAWCATPPPRAADRICTSRALPPFSPPRSTTARPCICTTSTYVSNAPCEAYPPHGHPRNTRCPP